VLVKIRSLNTVGLFWQSV